MSEIFRPFIGALQIVKAEVPESLLTVHLNDERIISLPLKRFPKLEKALRSSQHDLIQHFKISVFGYGIHWPRLDEDISIKAFL